MNTREVKNKNKNVVIPTTALDRHLLYLPLSGGDTGPDRLLYHYSY